MMLAVGAILLAGCYNDTYEDLYPQPANAIDKCDTATNAATYSGNVKPIMDQYCATAGCHDASTGAGGYDLSNYTGTKGAALDGVLVSVIADGSMPKGGSALSACDLKQVAYWVNKGAPNN